MDGMWQELVTVGIPVGEKILRTVVVYGFLVAGIRLFGKRELGQLNPLDIIILLLLANTVQNAIIGRDDSLFGGLIGATTLFVLNGAIVRLAYRKPRIRRLIEGRAEVVIAEGRVNRRVLDENSLSREELVAAARKHGIDNISDVESARLEVSGEISFTARDPHDHEAAFRAEVLRRLAAIEGRLPAAVAAFLVAISLSLVPASARAQAATDIWTVSVQQDGRRVTLGTPANLTRRPGYDNQPSFAPDGTTLLYTAIGANGQADSWSIRLPGGAPRRLTDARIGVYSPTVTPDPNWFSVIRVEADSTQRLWKFPLTGSGTPVTVFDRIKPVGYHAWIDDHTLALFVLGSPATLQIADTRTGVATVFASGVGRALVKVPHHDAVNFMQVVADSGQWVAEYDVRTKAVRRLGRAPQGADYIAWTQRGALLTAAGSTIYQWNDGTWTAVADFAAAGVRNISRVAINLQGDRLAFVAEEPRSP